MAKSFKTPKELVEIAVDVVVFTINNDQLSVLLVSRSASPYKDTLVIPGGFLWQNETTEEAARRVLEDKTKVTGVFIEQLYTFDQPMRDPRGRIISIAYYALVPSDHLHDLAKKAQIYPVDTTPKLGFDHSQILKYAVSRLRSKLEYTNAAYSLLPPQFTLSELQRVYEIILNHPLDKRNFRKKILSLDMIKPTRKMQKGEKHRPARFYAFKKRQPHELHSPVFYQSN